MKQDNGRSLMASVVNKGRGDRLFQKFQRTHNFNFSLAYGYTSSVDQSNQNNLFMFRIIK
jgi:ribonuclease HII